MELCFFEPSLKIEIGFRKLGVQRIKEMLSVVFGLWALGFGLSCHFLIGKAQGEIKNTVISGEGKEVLIYIIKRFKEPGFRVYSISVNLMLELNSL